MYELELAKELICKEKYDKAIVILEKLIKNNDDLCDAFFELGKIYFIKKDFNKAILNFRKSISVKNNLYSNLLLAESFKHIGKYRESLRNLFKIKKFFFENEKKVDVEIIDCFLLLKRYLFAYRYFNKYSINDDILQKRIICNLLSSYNTVKKRNISKEIENFVYEFLNNSKNDDKTFIEQLMLELYKNNFLSQKENFYKYIFCKNKEKNNIEKAKHYNFILNKLEIKRKDTNLFSKPISLVVTLTNACNIKCSFCSVRKFKLWNLPREKVDEIIELMPYLKSVSWLGGEVFLYKDFDKLFDMAVKNNVFQEIITNGLLLNEDKINKFITTHMKLSISITSVNKEKYEILHRGSAFEQLLSNLDFIKNNINKRKNGFSYWMYVCVMSKNISELEDIIEFAHKYKFDVVRFQPLDQLTFEFYNRDIVKYFVNKAILKANYYNIKINNILPINLNDYQEINFSETKIQEELNNLLFYESQENMSDKSMSKQVEFSNYKELKNNKKEIKNNEKKLFVLESKKRQKKVNNDILINEDTLFCEHPWTTMIIDYGGRITFECFCSVNKFETINDKTLLFAWNSPKVQLVREKITKRQVHDICNYNCIEYNVHKN